MSKVFAPFLAFFFMLACNGQVEGPNEGEPARMTADAGTTPSPNAVALAQVEHGAR